MSDAIQIGLSGLVAASSRLQTAANNIANVNTTSRTGGAGGAGFQPQRTQQTPLPGGGVQATQVPVTPSHQTVFSPGDANANDAGQVDFPNVSLAEEMVQLKIAAQTYKANAAVIRTALELSDALLEATRS